MLTDHVFTPVFTDYGYTCRYNREVKRRGRAPTITSQGSNAGFSDSSSSKTLHATNEHQPLGPKWSSPPPESSEVTASPSQLAETLEKYRDTRRLGDAQPPSPVRPHEKGQSLGQFFEMYRDGHDLATNHPRGGGSSFSHIGTQPHIAPPLRSFSYIASPAHSTSHTQMHLSSLLGPNTDSPILQRRYESPSHISAATRRTSEGEALVPDGSIGYSSPTDASLLSDHAPSAHGRSSFGSHGVPLQQNWEPSSTTIGYEGAHNSLYRAPSADCRYRCLEPVLPYLRDIIPASVACDLLDVYLTEPGSSLFRCASPYIITRIFRKKSLLHPVSPRKTTPALLATMLWCSAQTADIVLLQVPGSRAKICNALYDLATALISDRDPDRWRRMHGISSTPCLQSWVVEANINKVACGMRATHRRAASIPHRHSHSPLPGMSPRALSMMC